MKALSLLALLPLGACATSAAGLAKTNVEMTVLSQKSSQEFATCVAERLIANNQLRSEGDHYWVLRFNGYGLPVSRWDFKPAATGSIAELRATISVNTGDEKVKTCA